MTRLSVVLPGLMAFGPGFGQADSLFGPPVHDELTLLTAYHQGRYGFVELGLGRSLIDESPHWFPIAWCYHLGAEFRVDQPELIGLKAGAYYTCLRAFGLQYIHYMDGTGTQEDPGGPNSTEVIRPELGLGLGKFKVSYAYNIALTPRMSGVSTHMFSVAYAWRLVRLPGDFERRSHRVR